MIHVSARNVPRIRLKKKTKNGKQPLAVIAYNAIYRNIISLVYEPGQRLEENHLVEQLGIGRTPIREALLSLAADLLVELSPGNDRFGYYETIGGGAEAGPTWHGQTGVHTHMTNTRITDPEILERRYPLLLKAFSVREGSGGDGLVREVEFLEPLNMAILSERRVFAPYGMEGGEPGKRGENIFIHRDGRKLNLGAKNEILARPGDRFRILTPGGGGFGRKKNGK